MKKKHLQWISYTILAAGLGLPNLSAGEDLVDITHAKPEEIPAVIDVDGNPLVLFTGEVETQERTPEIQIEELTVESILERLQNALNSAQALSAEDKGEAKNLKLTIARTNISLKRLQQALDNGETVNPGIYENELKRREAEVQKAIERMQERIPLQEEALAEDPNFDAEIAFQILNEELQALKTLLREVRKMIMDPIFRKMKVDLNPSSYIQRLELFGEMDRIQGDINRLTQEDAERLETTIEGHITYVESFREQLVQYLVQQQEIANVVNGFMQELQIPSDIRANTHPSS